MIERVDDPRGPMLRLTGESGRPVLVTAADPALSLAVIARIGEVLARRRRADLIARIWEANDDPEPGA